MVPFLSLQLHMAGYYHKEPFLKVVTSCHRDWPKSWPEGLIPAEHSLPQESTPLEWAWERSLSWMIHHPAIDYNLTTPIPGV